jgi:hypothetical protein
LVVTALSQQLHLMAAAEEQHIKQQTLIMVVQAAAPVVTEPLED